MGCMALSLCSVTESRNRNLISDQPRGLVVRVSDYLSWGPGFDSRFYHGNFSLQEKIPVVTKVCVVSRFRLKAPPGISSSCISPLTSSGQHSRASWASQPQKSATLSPQPWGKPRKFIRTCGGTGGKKFVLHKVCKLWFSNSYVEVERSSGVSNSYRAWKGGSTSFIFRVQHSKWTGKFRDRWVEKRKRQLRLFF